jgi:hypothetical protein
MDKLKRIEPNIAALGIGIFSLFTMWMLTIVMIRLFELIHDVVLALNGQSLG